MSTKKNRSFPRMRMVVSIFAVAVALSAALIGVLGARRNAAPPPALPGVLKTSVSTLPQRGHADIQAELVTIAPHGFEPQELTRPRGRFVLMIENRSGLEAVTLRLTREGGTRVRQMRVPREAPDWSEVVDLEPGRYQLSEANHSDWICVITITR